MSKYRKLMVLVALIAALTMLATMTGVSFAAGGGTTNGEEETTCVIGYVINHRELVVDGTKFDPQLSVMYEGSSASAEVAAPVAAAEAMTATAPMTATEAVTAVQAVEAAPAAPAVPYVLVDSKGYFSIPDLAVGDWNFMMQLPADWAGIVGDRRHHQGVHCGVANPLRILAPRVVHEGLVQTGSQRILTQPEDPIQQRIVTAERTCDLQRVLGGSGAKADAETGAGWADDLKNQNPAAAHPKRFDLLIARGQVIAVGHAHPTVSFGIGEVRLVAGQLFAVADHHLLAALRAFYLDLAQARIAAAQVEYARQCLTTRQ